MAENNWQEMAREMARVEGGAALTTMSALTAKYGTESDLTATADRLQREADDARAIRDGMALVRRAFFVAGRKAGLSGKEMAAAAGVVPGRVSQVLAEIDAERVQRDAVRDAKQAAKDRGTELTDAQVATIREAATAEVKGGKTSRKAVNAAAKRASDLIDAYRNGGRIEAAPRSFDWQGATSQVESLTKRIQSAQVTSDEERAQVAALVKAVAALTAEVTAR